MIAFLRRFWHRMTESSGANLEDIQRKWRARAGYRMLPPTWQACIHCGTLVSGSHDCPKHPERLAQERIGVVEPFKARRKAKG